MSSWVVGRARVPGVGDVWVWGQTGSGAGFDQVFYTRPDGFTPADVADVPDVAEILFVVPIDSPEVAPKRDTFPGDPLPFDDPPATVGAPTGDED